MLLVFWDTGHWLHLLCLLVCLLGHFHCVDWLKHIRGSIIYIFPQQSLTDWRWMPNTVHNVSVQASPFHFLLFAVSSLDLWGWWYLLSDTVTVTNLKTIQWRPCLTTSMYFSYFIFKDCRFLGHVKFIISNRWKQIHLVTCTQRGERPEGTV